MLKIDFRLHFPTMAIQTMFAVLYLFFDTVKNNYICITKNNLSYLRFSGGIQSKSRSNGRYQRIKKEEYFLFDLNEIPFNETEERIRAHASDVGAQGGISWYSKRLANNQLILGDFFETMLDENLKGTSHPTCHFYCSFKTNGGRIHYEMTYYWGDDETYHFDFITKTIDTKSGHMEPFT